ISLQSRRFASYGAVTNLRNSPRLWNPSNCSNSKCSNARRLRWNCSSSERLANVISDYGSRKEGVKKLTALLSPALSSLRVPQREEREKTRGTIWVRLFVSVTEPREAYGVRAACCRFRLWPNV